MKNIILKTWQIGAVLIVIIGGGLVFSQFYDINLARRGGKTNQVAIKQEGSGSTKISKAIENSVKNLNKEYFSVDLKNLSEEELASVAAYLKFKKIKNAIIPFGIPKVYGKELNVSFDKVQDSMNKMASFGLTYGRNKISLNSSQMRRYINIGSQTACKYCCGAKALVFPSGKAACGCAHSQTMRGLAAYLIKNHPEFSDKEILNDLNTWRASFFPKQTLTEALSLMEKSGVSGIKNLMKEFPDFLPQMVGGC